MRRLNFTLRRCVAGQNINVPVLGGLKAGLSGERFLFDILRRLLPKIDGCVIDVGTNLGQTLCKVKLVDPGRSYYGFEPNAACHAYLDRLVQVNDWRDVTIFPFGLSNHTAILCLHVPTNKPTAGRASFLPSILPGGKREGDLSRRKHAVVFSYAETANLIPERIGFLKIDVEGMELEVLRGIADTISRDEPVVAIELVPDASRAGRREETVRLLRSLGYEVFAIEKGKHHCLAGLTAIVEYAPPDDPSITDYIAIPKSKRPLLDDALNL